MYEVEEKILWGGVGGGRGVCGNIVNIGFFFILLIILLCDFNKF